MLPGHRWQYSRCGSVSDLDVELASIPAPRDFDLYVVSPWPLHEREHEVDPGAHWRSEIEVAAESQEMVVPDHQADSGSSGQDAQ